MKEKLNTSINLALLLLAVFCQTEMLRETLGFPVDSSFYLWLVLLCVGLWYTAHGSRFNSIGIFVSLLVLFLAYRLEKPDILSQLTDFFDRIANLVSERFLLYREPWSYRQESAGYSFLFLSLGFLEAAYLAIALSSRGARTDLALLGTLPFTVFCVAVSDHPPLYPLLGMLLFWFLTAIGGSYFRKESGSGIGVLTALLPLVALLAALLLIVNPQSYEYQPPRLRLDKQLIAIGNAFRQLAEKLPHEELELPLPAQLAPRETQLTEPSPAQQGEPSSEQEALPSPAQQEQSLDILWQDVDGNLDLTMETDSSLLDQVFLRVRAAESGPVYLRALSFGDYTGTAWLPAEENAPASSLAYTAEALASSGASEKQLSVTLLFSAPYRFTPYFSEESGTSDSYIPAGNRLSYASPYRLAGLSLEGASLPQELAADELSYREYAHRYYTRLPEATKNALLSLLEENRLLSSGNPVSEIAAFVQQTGQYDVEVGSYPSDDYALYFLTDSQRGYCIHFATAAAALYRAAGIPARVTEGFLVHAEAGKIVDVSGADAHAWVEIYQDGLGWLPVEVTGQSGLMPDPDGIEPAAELEDKVTEAVPPAPVEEMPSPDSLEQSEMVPSSPDPADATGENHPAPTEMPASPSPAPSPSPTPQLPVGIITDPSSSEKTKGSRFSLLWLLLLPVLIVLLLPFIRFALRCRKVPDAHHTVLAAYNTSLALAALGAPVSPQIKALAEKAAFSRNSVTEEEAENCKAELRALLARMAAERKPLKRLRLKLLLLRIRWRYPWISISKRI